MHAVAVTASSYDEIPYDSVPIAETHPANLAVQAMLFGLKPADPERCRVLELGCASGGNLIPMAFHLPHAEFLGIELSAGQVATGRALIAALGLRNVRIEQADIMDVRDLGQFDYFIAHGLYSWVPPAVRERIFALCAETLSPDGIAYVSYNTLPGWRLRSMVRDMLLFFVRGADTPRERLARAYQGLEQLEAAFAGREDLMAKYLHEEVARLRRRHESYVYHEYLAEVNEPVSFAEFMGQAQRHGLQYLCEAELQTMLTESLGEAAAALVDRYDTVTEQEQCIDFLRQRMFRQTLLCRAHHEPERQLELERFRSLAFYACLAPQETADFTAARAQPYATPDGGECTVQHPLTKAALEVLAQHYPDALACEPLTREAAARLPANAAARAAEHDHLLAELVGLYLRQYVGVSAAARRFPRGAIDEPRANALARAQAAAGLGHIATVRHMPMGLDAFAERLVMYLDGTRPPAAIIEALTHDIAQGRLRVDQPAADPAALTAAVRANCERLLAAFARHGVLEA
jgi:methyltransferase-like protein